MPLLGNAASNKALNIVEIGTATIRRAVNKTLHVCANGNNDDGLSWSGAYTSIQTALSAASTDANDCTLILVAIGTGKTDFYDINTTGDPTYTGNYIIQGTHRTWTKIKNNHASATSILKFTGYTSLIDLNFNMGGGINGVVMTKGAFRIRNCQFVGEDATGACVALNITGGATALKHGIIENVHFKGETTTAHMTAIKLDNITSSLIERIQIHECVKGIQITDADSDENLFYYIDIGDGTTGFDIDAGNEQHIEHASFHHNVTNIDDEVGDHMYFNLIGHFPIEMNPASFSGVAVNSGDGVATYGALATVYTDTNSGPFRIVGINLKPGTTEWYMLQLTADDGATYFDTVMFYGNKQAGSSAPSGTEFIFNRGTVIKGRSQSESAGVDNLNVWLEIQTI